MNLSERAAHGCPPPSDLEAFSLGQLANEAAETIANHLTVCDSCGEQLDQLVVSDPLLQAVGSSRPGDSYEALAGYQSGLAACERLLSGSSSVDSGTLDQAAVAPRLPDKIGHYQLTDELGQGGMGRVYRAIHTALQKEVALKLLSIERTRDQAAIQRFEREMLSIGRLKHPHVVEAIDASTERGRHFLVLEYVRGLNLDQVARRHGPLSIGTAAEAIRQAALGLQHAHEHGIVHRDVKPSNLLLDGSGMVKLADFGLALLKPLGDERPMTGVDQIMGTVDYIAPEQIRHTHAVDIRSDIYGLGCTLFFLLTGRPPFVSSPAATFYQRLQAHIDQPPPRLLDHVEGVPEELDQLCGRMLAKSPSDRFKTPADVAAALEPFASPAELARLAGELLEDSAADRPADAFHDTQRQEAQSTSRLWENASPRAAGSSTESAAGRDISRRFWRGLLGVGLLLATAAAVVTIYLRTADGVIELTIEPADATVLVDGEPAAVGSPGDPTVRLTLPPGEHRVTVRKDGFQEVTRKQDVTRGEAERLIVALEPAAAAEAWSRIIDDGDEGYRESGTGWKDGTVRLDAAYGGDYRISESGAYTANWLFSNLPSGRYDVFATWNTYPNRAIEAKYEIHDAARMLERVGRDQMREPEDDHADGQGWRRLGTYDVTSGALTIVLDCRISRSERGGGAVADAMRVVRTSPSPPQPTTAHSMGPVSRIINNGEAGYYETGDGWKNGTARTEAAYRGDYRYNSKGALTANWVFGHLPPGLYDVYATWNTHENRANRAVFHIHDAAELVHTLNRDQIQEPADVQFDGQGWNLLGTFRITSGALTVTLDSRISRGGVVADAVRVVRRKATGYERTQPDSATR